MKLFIEPVDVWLFRDGRPFDLGGDHQARTVFPPLPTVMQGAIRSNHLAVKGVPLQAYLGRNHPINDEIGPPGEEPPEHLRFRGPFVAKAFSEAGGRLRVERYFPLPADAVVGGDGVHTMRPSDRGPAATNLPSHLGLIEPRGEKRSSKGEENGVWISESGLRKYLQEGLVSREFLKDKRCLYQFEHRFGIGRDDSTRGTKEGLLYEAEKVRLGLDVGLYVEVEGLAGWPAKGIMALGGEGHGAFYTTVEGTPPVDQGLSVEAGRFKILFLTPTYFRGGWQPENWSILLKSPVQFKGAAVGKPLVLGGFDLAQKQHKPARRYVPAGSVYFFEGTPPRGLTAITEYGENIGFGQFVMGGW